MDLKRALLLALTLGICSCRQSMLVTDTELNQPEPETGLNLPPQFLSEDHSLRDTLLIGDYLQQVLEVEDPEGQKVTLSASREDVKCSGDSLLWRPGREDIGPNVILVFAEDKMGAMDTLELRFVVLATGSYVSMANVTSGMDWKYESSSGYGSSSPRTPSTPSEYQPYSRSSTDTAEYFAITGDSIAFGMRNNGILRDTTLTWDRGRTESDPNAKFGYFNSVFHCVGQVAAAVDTVHFGPDTSVIRVVYDNARAVYTTICPVSIVEILYFMPGIGLFFSYYRMENWGTSSSRFARLIHFNGRPVDLTHYMSEFESRLLPAK